MNEDFLKALHANMGGDKVGSFEEFKNEFRSNVEFQKAVHANIGGDNVGSFDEFRSELFGEAPKKVNKKPTMQFAPEQEALLDAISDVEAPDYNVIVGGGRFDDFSDHPRKVGVVTEYGPSTAAGRLQFTESTWDEINKVLKLPDFSPDSQKIAGLYYAETRYKDLTGGRDIYEDIAAGRLETIQQVLGGSGGSTVWQGLQGDKEFAERYKGHLKRYQDQVKPPEPKTMQEAAQDLDSAMQGNKKMAESLQYNLGETTVEPTPKKVPEDMGKIKERLDQERVSLKAVDHDFKQKVSTRQDELWGQFEQTPVAKSIQEKYANEYSTHFKKSEENVKATPEFLGLQQKIQDDVNRRVITPDEGNAKLTEYLNEKISADQSLSEIKLDIDGRLKDESLSVFQGYTSKDEILGSLIKQREDIWGQSTAFQTELINSYNSKIEDYNKQAQSQAQANQPKASKEVGLQGGGPYAPGQRPQDYTGGLIKINKTSSDYDKDLEELDSKVGLKKDAALAAWYSDQGREVPTQKSKDLTKKSTEYFKKGKEIKLKRYEALKQEIFTMSPIELGRSKIEDFTQKVQEYGDVQRGYFEQDNVAVQAYVDELVKFREGADLALSEKFGDRYDDFKEDQAAIEILIKSGADVKDKVKNFREKYKDIEEDDDHLLSSREIPKLYQQAKFEQSQLADAYQQGERLKRVEETQKYANENPVMAAIAGTLGKAIGAVTQTAGSLLEQAEKAPLLVKLIPGFAQLSGFLPKGSLEKGISELGEMGRVAGGDIKAGTPFSTKMQGQVNETFSVTPSGKRVIYSPNTGEVQYIRNEDGTLYEGYEADVIIKSAEGLKKQQALNPFSLIGQMLDIGAEMIPTIALSYGTAGAGAAAGLGSTGVGVMSKMGMFMGGYSQGYSQAKEEALKQKGLSFDQAEAFAVTTGLITGAVENFNPLEGRIFSKSLSKSIIKDNLLELASGRVSGVNWADNITINFLKGGLKESLLEEVPQAFADNALKNYYNSKKGSEFVADVSSDQWKDIILTSFAMGGIGDAMRSGSKSDLGKEALKVLVNNREMYDAYISGMEKTSPEMAAKIRSDIDPLLSEIDSVEGLTPKRKERSVELLFDIRTLESKLAPIVEPTLRKPIEDQIVELRKELGSIVSVPTDDYGNPLDEVAEAEKAAKEAEKTKEKVSKPSTTPTPKKPEEPPTPPAPAAASVAVEETKPAVEIKATFVETPKQSVVDTQTTEQGVESTQGEIVAPTKQAEAQTTPLSSIIEEHDDNANPTEVLVDKLRDTTDSNIQKLISDFDSQAKKNKEAAADKFETAIRDYSVENRNNLSTTELNEVKNVVKEINNKNNEQATATGVTQNNTERIPQRADQESKTTISQAKEVLRRGNASAYEGTQGGRRDDTEVRLREDQALKTFAKGVKKLFSFSKVTKGLTFLNDGAEQRVYANKDGATVTKINTGDMNNTRKELLDRIELHNEIFPETTYTVVGFVQDAGLSKNKFGVVMTQPYVDGIPATKREIQDDLEKRGFVRVDKNGERGGMFEKDGVLISDVFKEKKESPNVIKMEDGSFAYIDPNITTTEKQTTQQAQPAADAKAAPTQETLEQAVQKVDSTSINLLDEAINRAQKDLETETDPVKKEDIQQTINSLTKTRDQLLNTQTTTNKLVNNESIKSESKTSSKGEEGKVGTTVAQEQGKGLGEEVSTQEEVNTESLQTKDPTQKAAQDLVTDSKKTIDELSQDQAAAILDYMKGLKIDISGLKTDCKK